MYPILEKRLLAEGIWLMKVLAPRVARSAQPGQFVIVRADEHGERIPLTISDFDAAEGSVTIVTQAIGASTRKICALNEGDALADFAGPLGHPSEFVKMPVEELRKRRYQRTIIIISAKNELFYGKRSADCGANGFVSKKEGMNNILAAIDAANNGYSYFPFSLERFCTHGITDQDRLDTLSTQEMKVFRYILSGVDYTTIGSKMNISNKTVSTYKVRLMDKLGCSTLLELYDFAQRNKIG